MVEYNCDKCNRKFNKKSTWVDHIQNRKKPCTNINNNLFCVVIEQNNNDTINSSNTSSNSSKTYSNGSNILPMNTIKDEKGIKQENKIICKYCCKIFLYNKNLNKHIREERCEILKLQKQQKENIFVNLVKEDELNKSTNTKLNEIEPINPNQILLLFNELKEMKNILEKEACEKKIINEKLLQLEKNNLELQKQNYKLQNKMDKIVSKNKIKTNKSIANINNSNNSNNSNNTNTQNITNTVINNPTIKLVNFGSEDLTKISHNVFIDTIKSQGAGLYNKAIDGIHFNKDHPENHNIYISDFNRDKVMIYQNEKWFLDNWDNIYPKLLEKVIQFGYDKEQFLADCDYNTGGKKFNKQMIRNAMRWYKLLDNEETDIEYFELDEEDRPEIDEQTYNDYLEMQEFRKKHPKKSTELNIKNKMKLNIYNKKDIPIENYKKITNGESNINKIENTSSII